MMKKQMYHVMIIFLSMIILNLKMKIYKFCIICMHHFIAFTVRIVLLLKKKNLFFFSLLCNKTSAFVCTIILLINSFCTIKNNLLMKINDMLLIDKKYEVQKIYFVPVLNESSSLKCSFSEQEGKPL